MARGESEKSEPKGPAFGIWALFLAIAAGILLLIVLTTRSCEAIFNPPAVATNEPFAGATRLAGELTWRDCLDAAPFDEAVRRKLTERGYVQVEGAGTVDLPSQIEPASLEGACGVVVVLADPGAHITKIGDARRTFTPCNDTVATYGACEGTSVQVDGIGRARIEVWSMPGLTRAQLEQTGIPIDAALAHAEAETLLADYGFYPTAQAIVRHARAAGSTSPGPEPASGCLVWVSVTEGFSSGSHSEWGGAPISVLSGIGVDRGMLLAVSCNHGTGRISLGHPSAEGATIYSVLYQRGSGPALPGSEGALRIPSVRVVRENEIDLGRALATPPQ